MTPRQNPAAGLRFQVVQAAVHSVWELRRHSAYRFAVVGAACLVLTLSIIFACRFWFGFGDVAANAAGYLAGLTCSFVMNSRWTFGHDGPVLPALLRFASVFVLAYALNIATVLALIDLGASAHLAHLAGVPVYTLISYACYKRFVFVRSVAAEGPSAKSAGEVHAVPWRWLALTAGVTGVILGYRLGSAPIFLWDESRVANNALEMAQSGLSLVTTFDGVPDHWNTKPPLLIWMMSLSIRLLGANEWSVRLPSVLAAMATAWLMVVFCKIRLHKAGIGFVSVLLLLATPGYVQAHGARAGDYDAMLALFTTMYVMAAYLYFHGPAPERNKWLTLCATGIALAFMTKTIQGLIFVPALLLYAALLGRLPTMLKSSAFYACAGFVLSVCVGYYAARERIDPGYFAAVRANDLLGRFNSNLYGEERGPAWYFFQYGSSLWMIPGLLLAGWFALRAQGELRILARFLGLLGLFYLAVISFSKTKFPWYAMPIYPLTAMVVAVALDRLFCGRAVREAWSPKRLRREQIKGVLLLSFSVATNNFLLAYWQGQAVALHEQDHYSLFLRELPFRKEKLGKVVVLHPGYPSPFGPDSYYAAPTKFYIRALQQSGMAIELQPAGESLVADSDAVLVCGSTRQSGLGRDPSWPLAHDDGRCGLYKVAADSLLPR